MSIAEIIKRLESFWSEQGCEILWAYDVETGAGTLSPHTILGVFTEEPYNVAYTESCRRAQDARYGQNPSRLFIHHQFQVIMKPAPTNIEELYLKSLESLGLDIENNSVQFLEDNWAQPTLGAWGLGSEIRFNGSEITQFTYFKQIGNIDLEETPAEIAYGLERLASAINNVSSIYDLDWSENRKYSDVFKRREHDFSKYIFEVADKERYFSLLNIHIKEAEASLEASCPIASYDNVLKASHYFNVLDAQRALFDKERQSFILEISRLAKQVIQKYAEV